MPRSRSRFIIIFFTLGTNFLGDLWRVGGGPSVGDNLSNLWRSADGRCVSDFSFQLYIYITGECSVSQLKCRIRITRFKYLEPVFGNHPSVHRKAFWNERVVTQKRLFYCEPSLLWARLGGRGGAGVVTQERFTPGIRICTWIAMF